jgi:hypothetical protein
MNERRECKDSWVYAAGFRVDAALSEAATSTRPFNGELRTRSSDGISVQKGPLGHVNVAWEVGIRV